MDRIEIDPTWVMVIIIVAVMACMFGGFFWMAKVECDNKTASIGLEHQWKPLGGCLVEVQPDVWIPLDNYRWFGE